MGSRTLRQALLLAGLLSPASPAIADKLTINGIDGGDRVVVLVHARTAPGAGGCELMEATRSTGELSLGNLLPGCEPWIAILSKKNRMLLAKPAWTDDANDQRSVTLKPVIDVPVRVWIVKPDARDEATDHMAKANLLFEQNRVGVEFKPTYRRVTGEAVEAIEQGFRVDDDKSMHCQNLRRVQQSGFYERGALNVYYSNQGGTGKICAKKRDGGDPNIIYIGTFANRATLAHEFGHAFGLRPGDEGGHTENDPAFTDGNIMNTDGKGRRHHFSAGQVFRMNTHDDEFNGTMLIKNGQRDRTGRKCPPLKTNADCPPLEADWDRP
jgi:hypothetical protein